MNDIFADFNTTSYKLNTEHLRSIYVDAVKKYNILCKDLYMQDCIPSASFFDDDKFITYLFEEFPEKAKYLLGRLSQSVVSDYNYLDMLQVYFGEATDFSALLEHYKQIQIYRKQLEIISGIFRKKTKTKNDTIKVKPQLKIKDDIITSNKNVDVLDDAFYELLGYGRVRTIDLNNYLMKELCNLVFKDESVYNTNKANNTGIFTPKFTFEQDCRFVSNYIKGNYIDINKNTSALYKTITEYYKKGNVQPTDKRKKAVKVNPFNEYIYLTVFEKLMDTKVKEIEEQGYVVSYIGRTKIVFKNTNNTEEAQKKVEPLNTTEKPKLGLYLVDYETQEPLYLHDFLEGYSGEFISEKTLKKYNVEPVGLPIKLNIVKNKTISENLFYPIFLQKGFEPIFTDDVRCIIYRQSELLKKLKLNNSDDLYGYIRAKITKKTDADTNLIVCLVKNLIYQRTGIIDNFYSPKYMALSIKDNIIAGEVANKILKEF